MRLGWEGDTINVRYDYRPIFSLGRDTVICDGQIITLIPKTQNAQPQSYLWSTGATGTAIQVSQTGNYWLKLTNNCGIKRDDITISRGVCKLYIPSGFTPNNDGRNDVFKAEFGENVISYSLEIYNRSGQRIFLSNQINKGWDGKFNGITQPNDSYVWVIKYRILNDSRDYLLRGVVILIR